MTENEDHQTQSYRPVVKTTTNYPEMDEYERVDVPEEAIGVTVDSAPKSTGGQKLIVRYLVPEETDDL